MRINVPIARERQRNAASVVLPSGWYRVKIIEVEDRQGNGEAWNLRIAARVKVEGAVHRQRWNVNYIKRNGDPNEYGQALILAMAEAVGVPVSAEGEIDPECFEGTVMSIYLAELPARDYMGADGRPRRFPASNGPRDAAPDRKPTKPKVVVKPKVVASPPAEAPPFDDEIPF